MKKVNRIVAGGLLTAMMVFAAAGCQKGFQKGFDAAAYVKAYLDMETKGELEGLVKTVKITQEEAEKKYEARIDKLVSSTVTEKISEELWEKYREFFKIFCSKSKYEVKGSERLKNGDGYAVTIEAQRMKGMYENVKEDIMTEIRYWRSKQLTDLSDMEFYENAYRIMLDELTKRLDQITYDEPETFVVEVISVNGKYMLASEAYTTISEALLYRGEE